MEFFDDKIDPLAFEKMAKAYYNKLNMEVKSLTNKHCEAISENIIEKLKDLTTYINYLKSTKKAKANYLVIKDMNENLEICLHFFSIEKTKKLPQKTNLCSALKNSIVTCSEILEIVFEFKNFNNLSPHMINIIKNSVKLFGECMYRF